MEQSERKLSNFIDRLNEEQKPDEDERSTDSEELKELFQTVRMVRSLKEPAMPTPGFQMKLTKAVEEKVSQKKPGKHKKWAWFTGIASIAALMALIINFALPTGHTNIVNAMAAAFQDVKAYYGIMEIAETNASGESTTQAMLEVWADQDGHYYLKGLKGPNKDIITINNGQKKWQLQTKEREVHLFPAFPDAYHFIFELGNEINETKNALSTKVMGEETIAGRKASIVEVTPRGGSPYKIWIDKETNLPLQKQTAMQKSIQYKVTYTKMYFSESIPKELLAYHLPEDFKVIDINPEQVVNELNEIKAAVGFIPKQLETIPTGYFQDHMAVIPAQQIVKTYYSSKDKANTIILVQGKASGKFKPAPTSILGKLNNGEAEIQSPIQEDVGVLGGGGLYAGITDVSSIRWQMDGYEFAVVGDVPLEELVSWTKNITSSSLEIPTVEGQMHPQVEVPYDLAVEENDQKSVDAGSSPWKLDPVFSAQIFVSLKMSPNGITGEYPITIEELKVSQNNGKEAVIEVSGDKTPIKKVYLKRIVRQDSTGIWTIVGYDPK
ncbi:sigma-E factor regulatory protein RseB domain-containing protein [Neobacillus sp. OS1-2]|uniref:LolA family protein n=1 Tax=Neobacillus sp. OS1-2 TaxID=3070680 RepID=UPI0027DEB530|nr:sigma-E factor regulatory protein RseB domain-containing protein [Neobacillus sp. OS1-2]WML38259.1 sigma-E factor regulatory protein RseB domain-containing protein [Neobacillus sp. OS1-2]